MDADHRRAWVASPTGERMTMQPPLELSVVVPACNAGAFIESTIERLAARLSGIPSEVIVAENASTDDTAERCRSMTESWAHETVRLAVLHSPPGMGNALQAGVLASTGRSVLLTADDLPFGFDDLDAWDAMVRGAENNRVPVIIGSKAHADSDVERGPMREALTWAFALARRLILAMRTGDPQGTFIIDGALVRSIVPHTSERGFLFTTELVLILERMGVRPTEVPVRLARDHAGHGSRVSMRAAMLMAIGLFRLRWRHRHDDFALLAGSVNAAGGLGRT